MEILGVRIPKELKDNLRKLAGQSSRSLSDYIRLALQEIQKKKLKL